MQCALSAGFADASLRLMKPRLSNKRNSSNSDSPQDASSTRDIENASVGADSSADSSDTDSDTDSDSDSEDTSTDAEIDSSDSDTDSDNDDDTSEATSEATSATITTATSSTTAADPVPAELLKGVHLTLPSEKMAALLAARGSAQCQAVEQAAQAARAADATAAADSTAASAAVFAAGERKRFFVSLMDERIYKVGVFKRLRPRQRVKVSIVVALE
jgi:hypothetical protein